MDFNHRYYSIVQGGILEEMSRIVIFSVMTVKDMNVKRGGIGLEVIDDIVRSLSMNDPREVLHNGLMGSEIEKYAPDPLECVDIDEVVVWCYRSIDFIVKNVVSRWKVWDCMMEIVKKYVGSQCESIKVLCYVMYSSMPKYYRDKMNVRCSVDVRVYPKCSVYMRC